MVSGAFWRWLKARSGLAKELALAPRPLFSHKCLAFPRSRSFARRCPCFDADGSNVGNVELPVFANGEVSGPPNDDLDFTPVTPSSDVGGAPGGKPMLPLIIGAVVFAAVGITCYVSRRNSKGVTEARKKGGQGVV